MPLRWQAGRMRWLDGVGPSEQVWLCSLYRFFYLSHFFDCVLVMLPLFDREREADTDA